MRLRAAQWVSVMAAGALVALAGCGGGSAEGSGGTKRSDGSVTLTWQMWASGADEEKQLKHLTDDQLDSLCTVLALELDGELDLCRTHTRD